MTLAGEPASVEARRSRDRAVQHRRQADADDDRASRFEIAHQSESETAQLLAPLAGIGDHLLADRARPGSTAAIVDMVVVGASGVLNVDTQGLARSRDRRQSHLARTGERHRRRRSPHGRRVDYRDRPR